MNVSRRLPVGSCGRLAAGAWLVPSWLTLALLAGPALGDIFHLKSGGTVSGQLDGVEGDVYRVRTVVGMVRLPASAVENVESAPTPFDEYDRRVREAPDTAEAQTSLATWCEEQDLRTERRRHLARALELDPDYEPARRALGQVRVGLLWVDGRSRVSSRSTAEGQGPLTETDPERIARAIRSQWYRHIRAVRESYLDSGSEGRVIQGRTRILSIKDPLAILPLTEVLSRGGPMVRGLLVEALSGFPQDEATMNLAILALVDPAQEVRRQAVGELVRRDDPRTIAEYRKALHTPNEALIQRAAYALGELKATSAIEELIDSLTAWRARWVEVPVHQYFEFWPYAFNARTTVRLGPWGPSIECEPEVGVWYWADQINNEWRYLTVQVKRTQVLEALRRITGQDFGFEVVEWRRWLSRQQS